MIESKRVWGIPWLVIWKNPRVDAAAYIWLIRVARGEERSMTGREMEGLWVVALGEGRFSGGWRKKRGMVVRPGGSTRSFTPI